MHGSWRIGFHQKEFKVGVDLLVLIVAPNIKSIPPFGNLYQHCDEMGDHILLIVLD
jgi:hypothetical protein